ncbi:MAG: hypothetical protein J0M29_19695 [Chitinophagales bacterium]|nr:hypothetical protein [Chitinophagales bacterium]
MNPLLLFNSNGIEISDGLIVILFTLFVASSVNERIIDFIKLRFPVLWLKTVNSKDEIKRHQKLWILAFVMGMLTTALLDINMISVYVENGLVKTGDKTASGVTGLGGWLFKYKDCCFVKALGYLFAAIFISIGSKFWHDLLDLVLFVKNSKRKINAFNPKGVQHIEQVEQYLKEDDYDIAVKTLEANRDQLEKRYNTDTIYIGYELVEGQYRWAIVVMTRMERSVNTLIDNIRATRGPNALEYITNYGYVFRFPVLIQSAGAAYTTDDSDRIAKAGGGLFNSAASGSLGTFGCMVKYIKDCDETLLLTCCHCVKLPEHSWEKIDKLSKKNKVEYKASGENGKNHALGEIQLAYRNGKMDIALIKPVSKDIVSDYITHSGKSIPIGSRPVVKEDLVKKTRVWFSGARSGNCEGYIIYYNCAVPIQYNGEKEPFRMRNLIAFSKTSGEPYKKPCDKGDSGTILLEADTYKALGMIVASDDKFGYAIPMADILTYNELALFNDPCVQNQNV